MGDNEKEVGDENDPLVTYLEGDKVRVFHFKAYKTDDPLFFTFFRKDGITIKIQKQYVIKIECKGCPDGQAKGM